MSCSYPRTLDSRVLLDSIVRFVGGLLCCMLMLADRLLLLEFDRLECQSEDRRFSLRVSAMLFGAFEHGLSILLLFRCIWRTFISNSE